MYILYGIFSEKKWLHVWEYWFTEVVSDILYGSFTYTLDDRVSRVHKKGFYVTITHTVRYILRFYGTGIMVMYKKWYYM